MINKIEIIESGVVHTIGVNSENIAVIALRQNKLETPILILFDIDRREVIVIERSTANVTVVEDAFFCTDRLIVYCVRRDEVQYDYIGYDLINKEKKILITTGGQSFGRVPKYNNLILVPTDNSISVFNCNTCLLEKRIHFNDSVPYSLIMERGYLSLVDEDRYIVSGIVTEKAQIIEIKSGEIKSILENAFDSLFPLYATKDLIIGADVNFAGLYVWNKQTLKGINSEFLSNPSTKASCFCVSNDNSFLAWGDWEGRVSIYDFKLDRIIFSKKVNKNRTLSLSFDARRLHLFSGGDKADIYSITL